MLCVSASSTRVPRRYYDYSAAKAALVSLTRNLAAELGPLGVRVNAVSPTVTMTDMGRQAWADPAKSAPMLGRIPLGRFPEPSDVADAVLFLLSDECKMVHGQDLAVDGGPTAAVVMVSTAHAQQGAPAGTVLAAGPDEPIGTMVANGRNRLFLRTYTASYDVNKGVIRETKIAMKRREGRREELSSRATGRSGPKTSRG